MVAATAAYHSVVLGSREPAPINTSDPEKAIVVAPALFIQSVPQEHALLSATTRHPSSQSHECHWHTLSFVVINLGVVLPE